MQWKRHEVPCDRSVKGKRGRIWARLGKKKKQNVGNDVKTL